MLRPNPQLPEIADLARRVRHLQVVGRNLVEELLGGEYKSVFKGRGMEFEEVREYQPGDEVRLIDWNVTARVGRPFVKQFVEERDRTLFLLVDASASGDLGSADRTKRETAVELCALIALSASHNNDRIGLMAFTDEVERLVPPEKGEAHVLRLVRDLLAFRPQRSGTRIAAAIERLATHVNRRAIVFLVSDFQDDLDDLEKALKPAALRHDLIAVRIADPRELELPEAGLVELDDLETGEHRLVDTASATLRRHYAAAAHERDESLQRLFRRLQIDALFLRTDRDVVPELVRFFQTRMRRQTL